MSVWQNFSGEKSKVLVAFGSCAHEGCIPGLANLNNKKEIFDYVYEETPSTDNPEKSSASKPNTK